VTIEAEVGTCALCGQEMVRTIGDCYHPWNVKTACPPEPPGRIFWPKDVFPGRPGREFFVSAEDIPAVEERSKPLRWVDLFGIDPDFTEGVPIDEWLEAQRGEA